MQTMVLNDVISGKTPLINIVDFLLGVSGCQTDPENKKDLFQESHANGDRMV